jgi:DNA-binding transcriptional LysR family regulator
VLSYVEAGAGVGIATDSVASTSIPASLRFVRVVPEKTVPLVMVWNPDTEEPQVTAFRALVADWQRSGKLWSDS